MAACKRFIVHDGQEVDRVSRIGAANESTSTSTSSREAHRYAGNLATSPTEPVLAFKRMPSIREQNSASPHGVALRIVLAIALAPIHTICP